MEKATSQRSPRTIEITTANVETFVDTFLDIITPDVLVGEPEQRADFIDTLTMFKNSIQDQVPPLDASAMIQKLDAGVAARHYDAVWQAVQERNVTPDLLEAIRQTPVSLSPAQQNLDRLRENALSAQRQARNANEKQQPELRELAEYSAKVAASYAAETPVVQVGAKIINGEKYNLQKLHETKRRLSKDDDARSDVNNMVRDAYGGDYVLKDQNTLLSKARVAVASIAAVAVLSTIPQGAAHAAETKISEVLPSDPQADKGITDGQNKLSVAAKTVKPDVQPIEPTIDKTSVDKMQDPAPQAAPVKNDSTPIKSTLIDRSPQVNTDKAMIIHDKPVDVQKNAPLSEEVATSNDLVFKIPATVAKDKKAEGGTPIPDAQFVAADRSANQGTVDQKKDVVEAPVVGSVIDENATYIKDAAKSLQDSNEGLQFTIPSKNSDTASTIAFPDQNTKPVQETKIESILDEPKLSFQLPKERKALVEDNQIDIKVINNDDEGLSFSLHKDIQNPGVKPVELPGGLDIIPIPLAPVPSTEAPAPQPAPAPEKASEPKSDFSQAAQKMIERGGVWERRGVAMKFFVEDPDLALTPSQAAGFVGNLLGESNLSPGQNQLGGPAFGIAQWEGGRLLDLGAFGGKDQADFMTQLKFIKHELLGKERAAFNAIKTATNRKDAALIVRKMYERPSEHRDEDRLAFTVEVGDAFNKEYQAILAAKLPAKIEQKTDGILAGWPTTGEAAMKLFNQCDPIWGEIKTPNGTRACDVSCGPTSVAMAVNALTGRPITPKEVIEFTNANRMWLPGDRGTSFDAAINLGKNFGINGQQMANFKDFNAYKEILKNGGMILVAGSGPAPFVPQNIGAHFVLIRGISADGKFLVADPYPKTPDTNTVAWDADQIIEGTFGAVIFTK
jgi:hypothetical protein